MYVYFDSIVHFTYVMLTNSDRSNYNVIQIHPEPRPTLESTEDCGWVLKCFPTRVGLNDYVG